MLAALAAVVLAAAITVPGLFSALIGAPPASLPVAVASPSASASAPASASPGLSQPPSVAPSPSADPARTALDTLVGAISAAKGGPDGLKGKDANELESQAARVRRDLDDGDRARALKDARELDKRVRDAADHVGDDAAARLRSASADLVRALGG